MTRDYRDIVIEELAASEHRLSERVAGVEADCDAYELLAKQALHTLHDVTMERDRLRRRVHQLLDELRQVRQMNAGVHQISRAA